MRSYMDIIEDMATSEPTMEEVKSAIKRQKNGKAAGLNNSGVTGDRWIKKSRGPRLYKIFVPFLMYGSEKMNK